MSGFMDLLKDIPNPFQITRDSLTAPFQNRAGAPWLQSTARNFGHAAFGDVIGDYVDQHFLGDIKGPNGQLYYNGRDVPSATQTPIQPISLGQPIQTNPQTTLMPSQDAGAKLLMTWLKNQQQQG